MAQHHIALRFDAVDVQIPLFPHTHHKEKSGVDCMGNELFGGIPTVKQQQATLQAELR